MTLAEAIRIYVQRKRSTGMLFATGERTYRSFLRAVGKHHLSQIDVLDVSKFLGSPQLSTSGFRRRHSLLRHFFEYWAAHGAMAALPMPAVRPAQRSSFLPYIFSREEIRRVLQMASVRRTQNDRIHHATVRTALLMLYATGATLKEVTGLRNDDVDLQAGFIKYSGSQLKAGRSIPIGRDLVRVARQYVTWRKRSGVVSEFFFSRVDGREITPRALSAFFRRLLRAAGIVGYRGSRQGPCVRDLRATFAVHQITSWIKRKDDLNWMLPALGVYMGNVSLESAERYLQLTPERFQLALDKLSPPRSRTRWREDSALLAFLTSL